MRNTDYFQVKRGSSNSASKVAAYHIYDQRNAENGSCLRWLGLRKPMFLSVLPRFLAVTERASNDIRTLRNIGFCSLSCRRVYRCRRIFLNYYNNQLLLEAELLRKTMEK